MNFHLLTWFAVFTGILLGSDNGRLSAVLDNSLVKGSVAGFTSAVLLQPFDLIKTRWQERKSDVELPSIREICKKGGIRVLWRGLGPSLWSKSFGHGLYYGVMDAYQTLFIRSFRDHPQLQPMFFVLDNQTGIATVKSFTTTGDLFVGILTGVSTCTLSMPVNVIKTRLESSLYSNYKSGFDALWHIAANERLPGFYRGWAACALRDIHYGGVYLVTYYQTKRFFAEHPALLQESPSKSSAHINMIAGLLAGFVGCIVSHPFDTLRSRMQLMPNEFPRILPSLWKHVKPGPRHTASLWAGLTPRVLQGTLSSGISWTIYEELHQLALHFRPDDHE